MASAAVRSGARSRLRHGCVPPDVPPCGHQHRQGVAQRRRLHRHLAAQNHSQSIPLRSSISIRSGHHVVVVVGLASRSTEEVVEEPTPPRRHVAPGVQFIQGQAVEQPVVLGAPRLLRVRPRARVPRGNVTAGVGPRAAPGPDTSAARTTMVTTWKRLMLSPGPERGQRFSKGNTVERSHGHVVVGKSFPDRCSTPRPGTHTLSSETG